MDQFEKHCSVKHLIHIIHILIHILTLVLVAELVSLNPSTFHFSVCSSTQSWSNNESDSPQARPKGSHSSAGSLSSSYNDSHNLGSYHPSVTCSQKRNSPLPPLFQKGQTLIGSPLPHANSTCPIPIVLINGCPEQSEISPRPSRIHPGSFKQKMSSSSSGTFSGISSSNKTSSESSLSSSSSLDSKSYHPCDQSAPALKNFFSMPRFLLTMKCMFTLTIK